MYLRRHEWSLQGTAAILDFQKIQPLCTGHLQDTTDMYWTLTRHNWCLPDFN